MQARRKTAATKPTGRKTKPEATPRTPTQQTPAHAAVVGIGASAGGLEALKAFFGAVPRSTGLAYVVVVHLDPTHDSSLPELLGRVTSLPVDAATDRQVLQADHVYIIPPNRHLTVEGGLIRVAEPLDRRALRGTIDHFLRSLAADQHERAIAIILSGTGTEGTLGATAIKAEGGMVMAQDPTTAGQAGMPASVIATGLVDFVLAPEKMPESLLGYIHHPYLHASGSPPEAADSRPVDGLHAIVGLLRSRSKIDFRGYKKGTLLRRIERRMGLQQITSVHRYLEFLKSTPREVDLLFKDLLIAVTAFFRDPHAWDELGAKVLAKLVAEDGYETPIRAWVAGCATGEEAYSLAIAAAEQATLAQSPRRIQIFATDVEEGALETARAGVYPESIALDVSPQRLQRFFTREDHRFRVAKTIRESVIFANQNLISDPPFSKLDLVSCRNVLIYLEPDVQRKLVTLFHFALKPHGFLFLGAAENAGEGDGLFTPVSKRWRIHAKYGTAKYPIVDIPFPKRVTPPARDAAHATSQPTLSSLAEQQMLGHFAPAAVVVNRNGQILHFFGAMDRYLNLPTGAPTLDLAMLARGPLKPILRAVLHDGIRKRHRASLETTIASGRAHSALRITIAPVAGTPPDEGLSLVIFEETPGAKAKRGGRAAHEQQRDIVQRLEAELKVTKREQQGLVEQLEASNEELKAANEEVTSTNEELQSTNEELESSKEELQSMNEELSTVNAQLQEKVHELTALNDDLTNLLAATEIATVFVDADLRVSRFTEAATRLLNLIPADVGRPIGHLASNLVDFDLAREVEAVLRSRTIIERSVQARDNQHFIVRVLPYVRKGRSSNGVVVTLTDVTALKASENALRLLNQTLEERIRDRTRQFSFPHDIARMLNEATTWDDALRSLLQRICTTEKWEIGYIYLPSHSDSNVLEETIEYLEGDTVRAFHLKEPRRIARGAGLAGRVLHTGKAIWLNSQKALTEALPSSTDVIHEIGLNSALAFPLKIGGEMLAVIELFSTVANRAGDDLPTLLTDVGAQIGIIVDRERTMAQAAAMVWREQQSLVHTLHDSVGQQLTALAMLGTSLKKRFHAADGDLIETVAQIAQLAQTSNDQVRQLARGLFPIEVDGGAGNLAHALRQLATTTSSVGRVQCTVEEKGSSDVNDTRVATELYRIAQEAVTNALKHANASRIVVRLVGEPGSTILTVSDDGDGIRIDQTPQNGVGFRIMRFRAQSIGASLNFESKPGAGTVVTCVVRDRPRLPPREIDEKVR
ncbi:MAG TPA: chemotaxis protein CheB [Vicinamibacterales bacterium]|jgi:chemotaxis methyl-accepting protein methylase/signal transduction histidine kinase